jgi:hypothetical protein
VGALLLPLVPWAVVLQHTPLLLLLLLQQQQTLSAASLTVLLLVTAVVVPLYTSGVLTAVTSGRLQQQEQQ